MPVRRGRLTAVPASGRAEYPLRRRATARRRKGSRWPRALTVQAQAMLAPLPAVPICAERELRVRGSRLARESRSTRNPEAPKKKGEVFGRFSPRPEASTPGFDAIAAGPFRRKKGGRRGRTGLTGSSDRSPPRGAPRCGMPGMAVAGTRRRLTQTGAHDAPGCSCPLEPAPPALLDDVSRRGE
jgi:hypothetical protein